jgi:isoleucyl-tRNA synthetase
VSRVQRLRKEAGLEVSDRIGLAVSGAPEVEAAVRAHEAYVAGEVLAISVRVGAGAADAFQSPNRQTQTFDLDGSAVHVTLSKEQP